MKIRILLPVLTALFILLSLPQTVYANQPIRIEFENDTWEQVIILFGIHGPSSAPAMTRAGNAWVHTIMPDDPFFFGDLPQYLRFMDPTNRSHSLSARFYGSSRISTDGQVTPISTGGTCDNNCLEAIYNMLHRIYTLNYNLIEGILYTNTHQVAITAFGAGLIFVLIIAVVWSKAS